jgi:hypothetical protein
LRDVVVRPVMERDYRLNAKIAQLICENIVQSPAAQGICAVLHYFLRKFP